ncbi:MAG: hypothetical protein HYY89_03630, partial [candidate division NC10 bacterium]|nr:hypothetical protein [candidate division NC10 bacterium]
MVTVTGSGFSTSAPVRVLFDGAEVPSGPPVACIALAGTFCRTFIVPAGAGPGNHTVTAVVGSSPGESAT